MRPVLILTGCPGCKREITHYAKGVCKRCYNRNLLVSDPDYRERERLRKRLMERGRYLTNKAVMNQYAKTYRRRLRGEMIAAYGGCCTCCGEAEPAFLTLDHIHGGGRLHQKAAGGAGGIIRQLRDNGWPTDNYQLLCMNCNLAKFTEGQCPHTSR